MKTERDTYRVRLYKAEGHTFEGGGWSIPFRRFKTVPECQAYVDKIVNSAWAKRRCFPRRVTIKPGKGHRSAVANHYYDTIQLPIWSRKEWVILHELAHLYAKQKHGRHVAGHGREFAQCYIELVGHKLGKEAATALKAEFSKARVPWRKKKSGQTVASDSLRALVSF